MLCQSCLRAEATIHVRGPPAEIDEWTMRAALFGNAFCAATAVLILASRWLARCHWYATTGRWVTYRQVKQEGELIKPAGAPADPKPVSAGEWFYIALIRVWLLLRCHGFSPFFSWAENNTPRFKFEALFTDFVTGPNSRKNRERSSRTLHSYRVTAATRHGGPGHGG